MCYVHITYKVEFMGSFQLFENPKWSQKQQAKRKHSFRLLIAIAFRYHHYEHFYSKIDLTNRRNIVNAESGNSLNNKCVHFLDANPLKM